MRASNILYIEFRNVTTWKYISYHECKSANFVNIASLKNFYKGMIEE
jgi:hypothetical protein